MLAQEKGVGIVEIELTHIPVRYPALGLALWGNVFHHLTSYTTKPATLKTHQKLEKLHLNILTTA
jgi:hypothetical protein